MQIASNSAEETRRAAAEFAEHVRGLMPERTRALVVALRGDLGAGKTTFTQGFAHALGVPQTPKSPTFLLAKEYKIPNTTYALWHLDCYRFSSRKDLETLDLHHIFQDPHNIILVEWPEQAGDALPRDHIDIHFEHGGGDKRSITITGLPHA